MASYLIMKINTYQLPKRVLERVLIPSNFQRVLTLKIIINDGAIFHQFTKGEIKAKSVLLKLPNEHTEDYVSWCYFFFIGFKVLSNLAALWLYWYRETSGVRFCAMHYFRHKWAPD
jgi:hypothetical protein